MVIVSDCVLKELAAETLKAVGTDEEEAAWVAECLVLSNLKGVDSHGVQQIPGYVKDIQDGFLKPGAELRLLKEMDAIAYFDGGWGYGYTIAREAMKITMEKARKAGIAYTGIRSIHHIGRVGKWAEMALEEDMIGFASQPGGVYIAPWGGIDRKLPIAPIAVAIPTGSFPPIVIDMSLGPISGGRTAILALRDMKVPLGWYVDDEGKPTDDPKVFQKGGGAQLPLGQTGLGYKGMALSMVIDILGGPLLGLGAAQVHAFRRRGVFLGAINIEAFTPIDQFKECMDDIIVDLKSSRLAGGFEEILMPGEPEWREMERRKREGIFLDDGIYQRILNTAKTLGVNVSKFKGTLGKTDITHPSYTLKYRY
ncbi:MAG: Ldh family oxidoreductase [Candidatus Bathyarchaeota archaeon]|nr:Ldh family oxidoreductase [Candidatus Bathyarchaeota archaeon]